MEVLGLVDGIPLGEIVCVSEKTLGWLKERFEGLAPQKKWRKEIRFHEVRKPEVKQEEVESGWRYEPSRAVSLVELRLGAGTGWEGWYRVWQWWKQTQEIGESSYRKFCELAG